MQEKQNWHKSVNSFASLLSMDATKSTVLLENVPGREASPASNLTQSDCIYLSETVSQFLKKYAIQSSSSLSTFASGCKDSAA
jgi:hypothetical protein